MLHSTIHSDAQLLLQYDATQRRFGGMENLMKRIEQEWNHVFHTIGSENGAWDTGEPSGRFQSVGWNWKWTAVPSPFWQPCVNKSQFLPIASHCWPQRDFCQLQSERQTANIVLTCSKWRLHFQPKDFKRLIWTYMETASDRKGKTTSLKPPPVPVSAILYSSELVVFSAVRVNSTRQLPVQGRSYNVIYGSGVNYGNTDLPFTSHQTDNWPVSCCYDRRRGKNTVMPVYMFWCKRMANKTRFISDAAFDIWIGIKNVALVKFWVHVFFIMPTQLQQHYQLWPWSYKMPLKAVSHIYIYIFFAQQNVMTVPSLRFLFLFWRRRKKKKNPSPPPLFALSICISKKSHWDLLCIFTSD